MPAALILSAQHYSAPQDAHAPARQLAANLGELLASGAHSDVTFALGLEQVRSVLGVFCPRWAGVRVTACALAYRVFRCVPGLRPSLADSNREFLSPVSPPVAQFPAHRGVLSVRCPYFAAMFAPAHGLAESKQREVVIDDVEPRSFQNLLQ